MCNELRRFIGNQQEVIGDEFFSALHKIEQFTGNVAINIKKHQTKL